MKLLVLWEDQGATPNNFGPHELLLRVTADARRLGERSDHLKKYVQAIPCRGNGNVEKTARAMPKAERLVVYDADEVRRLLNVPSNTVETQVIALLAARCQVAANRVRLLHESIEDVLQHALEALGEPPLKTKPTPAQRDEFFRKLAWHPARERRDDFLKKCGDFVALRDVVVTFLQPISSQNP